MESHPEEDNHSENQTEANDALLGLSRTHLLYLLSLAVFLLLVSYQYLLVGLLTQEIDEDRNNHRNTSYCESEVIRISL